MQSVQLLRTAVLGLVVFSLELCIFIPFIKTDSGSPGESQNFLKSFNKCFCLKKALRIISSTNKNLKLYILFLHSRVYNSCLKKMCFSIFKKCVCNKIHKKWYLGLGGTSLVVQWLRPHTPNAEGTGFNPWSGNRSHMPHLRVHMPQLQIQLTTVKIPYVAKQTWHSKIKKILIKNLKNL